MLDKTISARELSKELDISQVTLCNHLARVACFWQVNDEKYEYKYTYNFLLTLKNFYEEKRDTWARNGRYYKKYDKVIKKLKKLLSEGLN